MKRGLCLAAALLAVWGLLTLALGRLDGLMAPVARPVSAVRAAPLILDAGHGGEDGGAVSVTGVPESRVNLEIVQKLRDTLALYGVNLQMAKSPCQQAQSPQTEGEIATALPEYIPEYIPPISPWRETRGRPGGR